MANTPIIRKGHCINVGDDGCPLAKEHKIIEVGIGEEFVCPECGGTLVEEKGRKGVPAWIWAVVVVVLLGAAGAYFGLGYLKSEPAVPEAEAETEETEVIPADTTVYVSAITVAKQAYTLTAGKEITIEAAVEPTDASDPTLKWSSSDETIATVADGTVKGVKAGLATITIQSNDGKASVSVDVTVEKAAERPAGPTFGTFSGRLKNGYPHGLGTLTFKVSRRIDSHDQQNRTAQPGDYLIGEWDNGHLIQARWYDASNNLKETIVLGKAMNPEQDHALGKFSK